MNPLSSLLLTDLYQLTMLQGYLEKDMHETAVFEFHARSLPRNRNFLMAAGQDTLLDFLENARFTDEELEWLAGSGRFSNAFVDFLAGLRFSGDVHALPEGTLFFPYEPIVRVTAPLPQAQLIESRLINIMHAQTLVASKAARCVLSAPGKLLVDFGLRRAHGAEAGLFAARASYLAGFAGTATVLAELMYGIPSFGTMAHSFIEAHESELEAFENFAHAQPDNVVLLIDTYDTEKGAAKVATLAPVLERAGIKVKSVRLDSGNLAEHAAKVRLILDEAGLHQVKIFTSGDLDEYHISELLRERAPIDGFGVGTRLDTSADAPYFDCAYKLIEYRGTPRRKKSEGKITWPGRKQVYREYDEDGRMLRDHIALESESSPGIPLVRQIMSQGKRTEPWRRLESLRNDAASALERLPAALRGLEPGEYSADLSPGIRALAAEADRHLG